MLVDDETNFLGTLEFFSKYEPVKFRELYEKNMFDKDSLLNFNFLFKKEIYFKNIELLKNNINFKENINFIIENNPESIDEMLYLLLKFHKEENLKIFNIFQEIYKHDNILLKSGKHTYSFLENIFNLKDINFFYKLINKKLIEIDSLIDGNKTLWGFFKTIDTKEYRKNIEINKLLQEIEIIDEKKLLIKQIESNELINNQKYKRI